MKRSLLKDQLLQSAERYVKQAMNHLTPDLPGVETEEFGRVFDQKSDELFVHFLFPNLDDYERSLLVALRHFRRGVTLGVHTRRDDFSTAGKLDHEKDLTESEANFVSLKEGIRTMGIEEKLTAQQRELLQEQFLTVAFQPF
ncbi:MAG: hypothetical protein L0Z50_25670 [Verrucomicrobiales bacterium]|nr:hypothetical protein [Verrucomicrobiales bacterium]